MSETEEITMPFVQLSGEDGNAFGIIARVSRALKDAGMRDRAKEFQGKAFACESYDELLQLTMQYCTVA